MLTGFGRTYREGEPRAIEPPDAVPVELRYGTPESFTSHEYVAFRVNQSFDAVNAEKSDVYFIVQPNEKKIWRKKHSAPLVLNSKMIVGKHLWISHPHLFCSDELHDGLASHGLDKGWRFEKQQVT